MLVLTPVADAYVSSADPTTNYGSAPVLYVGRTGSTQIGRALFRFDLSSLPAGATVLSATFQANLVSNPVPPPTMTVELKRIVTSWGELSVTWNNQPTYTGSNPLIVGPALGYYDWDVLALVQAWRSGTPNYGLALLSQDEAISAYRGFASKEHGGPPPRLVIIYEP